MKAKETTYSGATGELKTSMEERANRFNLKCLSVLCALTVFTEILNELNVFRVPMYIMRPTTFFAFILFSIPVFSYLIHDCILKEEKSVLRDLQEKKQTPERHKAKEPKAPAKNRRPKEESR